MKFEMCISNKFPRDADGAGPCTTLQKPLFGLTLKYSCLLLVCPPHFSQWSFQTMSLIISLHDFNIHWLPIALRIDQNTRSSYVVSYLPPLHSRLTPTFPPPAYPAPDLVLLLPLWSLLAPQTHQALTFSTVFALTLPSTRLLSPPPLPVPSQPPCKTKDCLLVP